MAAEIGMAVAETAAKKITDCLMDPLTAFICRVRYVFCLDEFTSDLLKAKTELEVALQDMKASSEEANRNAEKLVHPVELWLTNVEKVLEDEQKLEKSVGASKSSLNLKLRYSLAKQAEDMIEKMNELTKKVDELKKNKISEPTELPRMKYFSSKDFMSFDSRKSAYDKLLMAIQDDKSSMIGLVGLGGCGKTTLAKEVGKHAEELKLFDKVIMTDVSHDTNIRLIQGQIADLLSFPLTEETVPGRAQRLSERLKTEKILIILDDVWKKLDLEAVGIPLNENEQNSKILLTTRRKQVCKSMGCQSIIEFFVLTEMEGWSLFKQSAQIADDSPEELMEVARKIAKRCQGLPIAIVTVGSTLNGKTFDWWDLALSSLEKSQPIEVEEGMPSPYACLKLSYDNLTNQLAKSVLLLCCMFPQDRKIHLEDLILFGRGMFHEPGGLMDLGTMGTTRKKFIVAVNTLIDCCLLMPTNKIECVKMHGVVRDVSLMIASNEGRAILVANKSIPRMLTEDEIVKDKEVIAFWNMGKSGLLYQLLCPMLKLLLHHTPYYGYEIPNACLEGRKYLKVLALLAFSHGWNRMDVKNRKTLSIPKSIGSLTNLQTLSKRIQIG